LDAGFLKVQETSASDNELGSYDGKSWATDKRIAICVHGIMGCKESFSGFTDFLYQSGHYDQVWYFAYNYEHSVAENGTAFAEAIKAKIGLSGQKVDVFAHSMGGLVSRYAIEQKGAANFVRTLVTMGTPHNGSGVASHLFSESFFNLVANNPDDERTCGIGGVFDAFNTPGLRDCEVGSQFLTALNGSHGFRVPTAYLTVGGKAWASLVGDRIVSQESATFSGLGNQSLRWVPANVQAHHLSYMSEHQTRDVITRWLDTKEVRVQLTWDTDGTDVDLHLVRPGGTLFEKPSDCYFSNKTPDWGESGNPLDDPALDFDETGGFGAENIVLKPFSGRLDSGKYEVYVNYWRGNVVTNATVTVWVNGKAAERRQVRLNTDGGTTGSTFLMCKVDPQAANPITWETQQVRSRVPHGNTIKKNQAVR
jgi:pimeloyl-ACP methyl ester carboxylesterase